MISPYSKGGSEKDGFSPEGSPPEASVLIQVAGPHVDEKVHQAREQQNSDEKDKISVEEQLPV